MARWEAGLVVIVGIGLGAAIAAAALVPFSTALTDSSIPNVEPGLLAGGPRHQQAPLEIDLRVACPAKAG